jgi:hypothetical protein
MDQQAREQAFMNALATELFVLQAARGAVVGEQVGRGGIYMGAVSSALIALGFLAQVVRRLDPFVAAVLPALVVLGEFTFAALVRNSLENLVLLGQMQRIRGYYRGLVPEAGEFFDPPEADVLYQAAVATVGLRSSPGQALFTGASVVAAINSILGGAGLGAAGWAAGSPRGRGGVDGRGRRHRAAVCTASRIPAAAGRRPQTPVLGGHAPDDAPRALVVSRTGPGPSRRPGGVGSSAGAGSSWAHRTHASLPHRGLASGQVQATWTRPTGRCAIPDVRGSHQPARTGRPLCRGFQSVSARTTAPSSGRRSTLAVFTVPVMTASGSRDQNAKALQTPWWPISCAAGNR